MYAKDTQTQQYLAAKASLDPCDNTAIFDHISSTDNMMDRMLLRIVNNAYKARGVSHTYKQYIADYSLLLPL